VSNEEIVGVEFAMNDPDGMNSLKSLDRLYYEASSEDEAHLDFDA
jgi:hypothetical protein